MGSSKGELLGDDSVPVGVGLLDGEGGVAGNVAVVEWSADSIEGHGLGGEGSKTGLKLNKLKVMQILFVPLSSLLRLFCRLLTKDDTTMSF